MEAQAFVLGERKVRQFVLMVFACFASLFDSSEVDHCTNRSYDS